MPRTLSITELVRNFADYVNRVTSFGERFQVTRGGKPVAELGPVLEGRTLIDLPELVAGLPSLPLREADAFSADLDRARSELANVAPQDPWTS